MNSQLISECWRRQRLIQISPQNIRVLSLKTEVDLRRYNNNRVTAKLEGALDHHPKCSVPHVWVDAGRWHIFKGPLTRP